VLDKNIVRPLASATLGVSTEFDSLAREEGLAVAITSTADTVLTGIGEAAGMAAADGLDSEFPDISQFQWGDFVSTLDDWSPFISAVTWPAYISEMAWNTFIDELGWSSHIPDLHWTMFISGLGWAKFVGDLVWTNFINPVDLSSFIGGDEGGDDTPGPSPDTGPGPGPGPGPRPRSTESDTTVGGDPANTLGDNTAGVDPRNVPSRGTRPGGDPGNRLGDETPGVDPRNVPSRGRRTASADRELKDKLDENTREVRKTRNALEGMAIEVDRENIGRVVTEGKRQDLGGRDPTV
jgi:hypothetical protein